MYGLYDFDKVLVREEMKLRSGYAITNHIGSSVYLYKALRFNFELTSLLQHNHFDGINNLIFSPSIGIGYTFR